MSSTASQQHLDDSVWVLLFSSVGHLLNHLCIARGKIGDTAPLSGKSVAGSGGRALARVFGLLTVTMFLAGMIYYSTQTALPKLFDSRLSGLALHGTFGIGVMVAFVQGATGELYWLFITLSGFSLVALTAGLLLPRTAGMAAQPA